MAGPRFRHLWYMAAALAMLPTGAMAAGAVVQPLVERLPATEGVVPAADGVVPASASTLPGQGQPEPAVAYASPGSVAAAVGDAPPPKPNALPAGPVYTPQPIESGAVPLYPADSDFDAYETASDDTWQLLVLPDGLIYRSYLAGVKEPRFASVWNHDADLGWIWDISLGGRVGVLRWGTADPMFPDGWELDIEGAALLRLDPEADRDLVGTDYRFGIPLTFGQGPFRTKFGYYHLSSHLGDEFMLRYPSVKRDNYVHDSMVLGESIYLTDALRVYGEAAWAFYDSGRAKPWEFQFGLEYSPALVDGLWGAPFFAINGHLRQEFNYGGNLVVQTGWQWRGESGHLARLGVQYYVGKSDQWEFANLHEEKVGIGLWYDY